MAIDYPAGVYDLYMKYLNEIEQEGIASDASNYIPQLPYIFEGDGGPDPDDPFARRWDKEYDTEDFEALALKEKDEYGNIKIKYGLSEEQQALMDQIRGKQGFNLGTDWPVFMGGPTGMFGAFYNRRKASKRAEQDLAALVKKQDEAADVGQGRDIGGGWTQTDTGGGGATFTSDSGQIHEGWSNTPEGYAAAAESEASFAQGGRIGYGSGTAVPDPNRIVPEGDLATNLINYFANKFAGREQATPLLGGQTRRGENFMANLIPTSSIGKTQLSSLQDSEYQLQRAYATYVATGGDLEYEDWKSRQGAAQGGIVGLLN